jgi:hypothetical protein
MMITNSEYNERHLAQLIRRKMITKIKPSGKVYSRKKQKRSKNERFFCTKLFISI